MKVVSPEQATLLGSAFWGAESVTESIQEQTKMLKVTVGKLQHLDTHGTLLLLTEAFVGELATYIQSIYRMLVFVITHCMVNVILLLEHTLKCK